MISAIVLVVGYNNSIQTSFSEDVGCTSVIMQVAENDSAISFRRDSPRATTLNIIEEQWGNRTAVKQFTNDADDLYFCHVIITDDGWIVGDGGQNDGPRNKEIEVKAKDMISSGNISMDVLKDLQDNVYKKDGIGHFIIKDPQGNYGVAFSSNHYMGKLNPGQYFVATNREHYSYSGNLTITNSTDPVYETISISSKDVFGLTRRNTMSYHYCLHENGTKKCYGVDVFGSNDDGSKVGGSTRNLVDDVNFNGTFHQKTEFPMVPNKIYLGTFLFENGTNTKFPSIFDDIQKLFEK